MFKATCHSAASRVVDRPKQALMLEMLVEAGRNSAIGEILRERSREVRAVFANFLREGQERANGVAIAVSMNSRLSANPTAGI